MDPNTLRYWLSILFRRLPLLVATTVICTILGFALISVLPPVYRAAATIVLDPPQIAPDLARSTVPSDTLTQVAKIQEQILLRENLLDLAKRFDIYQDRRPKTDADIVNDLRKKIRIEFVKVGATTGGEGAATFSIAFDHRNPATAAAVVQYLVAVILDESKSGRTGRAGETLAFFKDEVATLGAALSKAEADILRFKNENVGALPDSLDFRYSQRNGAQERQVQLEREEAGLRSRRDTLMTLAAPASERTAVARSAREQELVELRRLLEQRLAVFAPDSPSVLDVKKRIAALERPQADPIPIEDAALPDDIRIQLSEIDGRLEFIEREKTGITETLDKLQASIAVTPGIETELNRLMRVYESANASYLAAVQRHAEASIGDQIETRLKGERLTLLEEPIVPEKPISPKRRKIVLAAILAGFGLGCAISVLLELLDGRVRRPAQLAQRLEQEPMAVIPYIDIPGEKLARRLRVLALGALALTASAIALVVFHTTLMPLDAAALRILHLVGLPPAG